MDELLFALIESEREGDEAEIADDELLPTGLSVDTDGRARFVYSDGSSAPVNAV